MQTPPTAQPSKKRRWPWIVGLGCLLPAALLVWCLVLVGDWVDELAKNSDPRNAARPVIPAVAGGAGKGAPEQESATQAAAKAQKRRKEEQGRAFFMSQDFIKHKLKAPGSAKFPDLSEPGVSVTKIGDKKYRVRAFVDYENRPGALLRAKYVAVLHQINAARWVCDELALMKPQAL